MTEKLTKAPPASVNDIDLDILDGALSFYIRVLNIAVSRDIDERFKGLEIDKGTGKVSALLLVDKHPGIRPSVIAQVVLRDRSAMGRLIDQMESLGLLRREISAEDNRAQELYITEKGAKLAEKVREISLIQSRDFFAGMTAKEEQAVIGGLRKIYRRIAGFNAGQIPGDKD